MVNSSTKVDIEAPATELVAPTRGWVEELGEFWRALPGKAVFGVLLAGWAMLFYCFGYVHAGKSTSLYQWMWMKWDDPFNDASHAKLIPWVVLAMLWYRRKRLLGMVGEVWWVGLAALALAVAIHVVGFLVQQPRLSMVGLFFGAWVLAGLVWGWGFAKAALFPFAMFAFCVPLGGTFAQGVTLPLRLMAVQTTYGITHGLLDVDLVRDGTRLLDPQHRWTYDVAAACSGIRSLIALLAITTILAGLTMRVFWKRAVIVALSIPLALVCNVLRLTTVILAANAFASQRAGDMVDHYFGYATYGIAVVGVLLVSRWLRDAAPPPSP